MIVGGGIAGDVNLAIKQSFAESGINFIQSCSRAASELMESGGIPESGKC